MTGTARVELPGGLVAELAADEWRLTAGDEDRTDVLPFYMLAAAYRNAAPQVPQGLKIEFAVKAAGGTLVSMDPEPQPEVPEGAQA